MTSTAQPSDWPQCSVVQTHGGESGIGRISAVVSFDQFGPVYVGPMRGRLAVAGTRDEVSSLATKLAAGLSPLGAAGGLLEGVEG